MEFLKKIFELDLTDLLSGALSWFIMVILIILGTISLRALSKKNRQTETGLEDNPSHDP